MLTSQLMGLCLVQLAMNKNVHLLMEIVLIQVFLEILGNEIFQD